MHIRHLDRRRFGVLAACTAGNCVNGLVCSALLSVVLVPMSKDFGWPRASITGVGVFVAPINIVLPLLVGWLADRFGARPILLAGNIGFALSLVAAGFVPHDRFVFYGVFATMSLFGQVAGPLLFGKILAGWFDGRRGTAMGLVAGVGNGLTTIVFPIIAAVLYVRFGWRGAYFGAAAIVAIVGFPAMFLMLRDPPRSPPVQILIPRQSTQASLSEALRGRVYWTLAIAMTLGSGCMLSVLSHTVPALTDRGFPLTQALPVMTCMSVVGVTSQILVGSMLDRVRAPWFTAPLYGASVIGIQMILHGAGLLSLLLGGALLGVGVGTEFAVLPVLLSRYFGLANYGKIAGATYCGIGLAGGLLPFLLDWSFDASGSYALGFQGMQAALLAGSVLICFLPAFSRIKPPTGMADLQSPSHASPVAPSEPSTDPTWKLST